MRMHDPAEKRQLYLFVNTVRLWAMFAVVALHCLSVFVILGEPTPAMQRVWMLLATPLKFGTIAFFLISGFLLGNKLQTCRAADYLGRRLKRVFLPWLFWYLMLVGYLVAEANREAHATFRFDGQEWGMVRRALVDGLFGSPLWFVPNLLLGICVLLMFRRYLYSRWLGLALLVPTAFYAVNIYFVWIPSRHAEALLGFVFYLWLGSYVAHRRGEFLDWVERVSIGGLVAAAAAAAALAWVEHLVLERRHSEDSLNTLRMSNQMFSVLLVLILTKLRRRTWPRFIDVRQEMFGVYLSHTIVLIVLLRATRYSLRGDQGIWMLHSGWGLAMLWGATVMVVWFGCLGLTKLLAGVSAMRWTVGAVKEQSSAAVQRE